MTLSVTKNKDGTITIACGDDAITLANPAAAGAPVEPNAGNRGVNKLYPLIIPTPPPANIAPIDFPRKTKIVHVPSVDDLFTAIEEQHRLHVQAQEPMTFQYHVKGDQTLNVEAFKDALAKLGDSDWMNTQINLTGFNDE